MFMGYVYQVTNKINGKRYIGHTTRKKIEYRINEHVSFANRGSNSVVFHKAIRKYGIDNFEITQLFYSEWNVESLAKEVELIAELKPEYNIALGGFGGDTFTNLPEEQKQKLIKSMKSLNNVQRLRKMAFDRRTLTDDQVREIREAKETQKSLAKKFNLHQKTIWEIQKRLTYKNVK